MTASRGRLLDLALPRRPAPPPAIEPGLSHYSREKDGPATRFHLRIEPDGRGLLLANASALVQLSEAGVLIAKRMLEGRSHEAISRELGDSFRSIRQSRLERDLQEVADLLETLAALGHDYPVINLPDASFEPHEARLLAPLAADVELGDAGRIAEILDRLWELAIPHAVLRSDGEADRGLLVPAVEHAEDLGLIAGARLGGYRPSDEPLLRGLAEAGVDYLCLPWASAEPAIHDGLVGDGSHRAVVEAFAGLLELEVCPVAEIPLIESTVDDLEESFDALTAAGVRNVSLFAVAAPDEVDDGERSGALAARSLPQVATVVEEEAEERSLRCLWRPPLRRDPRLSLPDQLRTGPRSSGDVAIRVESDGKVIPPRGPWSSAGNLLADSWQSIWADDAFRLFRERLEEPERCEICPGLTVCAADCPSNPAGWAEPRKGGDS